LLDVSAANAASASVRVSGKLSVRSGAANWHPQTRALKNGTKVTVVCKVTGQYIRGKVRRTAQWDRLALGDYISHAYVAGNPKLPTCAAPAVAAAPTQTVISQPWSVVEPNGSMTTAQFIAASVPGAQQSQREHRVPASVTIAQAILESGWGKSALAHFDKNYFGMKCFTQGVYANGCRTHSTAECTPAGACFSTNASFRTYASVVNSFRDHGALLATNPRYARAFNYITNANQFAAEIHVAGYATDPQYTTKLVAIMARYNLYQYDLR
jgi:flagellum-specific peptidoglycan hydrolase FlgJ